MVNFFLASICKVILVLIFHREFLIFKIRIRLLQFFVIKVIKGLRIRVIPTILHNLRRIHHLFGFKNCVFVAVRFLFSFCLRSLWEPRGLMVFHIAFYFLRFSNLSEWFFLFFWWFVFLAFKTIVTRGFNKHWEQIWA